jgi:hypothetical protein
VGTKKENHWNLAFTSLKLVILKRKKGQKKENKSLPNQPVYGVMENPKLLLITFLDSTDRSINLTDFEQK